MELNYFEQAEQAKLSLINKTVILAIHQDQDKWDRKVKILDANYSNHLVKIEIFSEKEDVYFNQLTIINTCSENKLESLKKHIESKLDQWKNPQDKTAIKEGSKCNWLYRTYKDYLTSKEWDAIAYNFNNNYPDFNKFSSDVLEMLKLKSSNN